MLNRLRKIALSPYFSLFIFLLSATAYLLGNTVMVVCMLIEVVLVAFVLVLSDDLSPTLLPILSLIVLGVTLIGDQEISQISLMNPYIPYGCAFLIPAVIFHVVAYRKKFRFRLGISFYGVVATALAILLSGIGNHDAIDYTDPTVIYYMLAMSVGLVLLYLLFSAEVKREVGYDRISYFLRTLCYVGGLCAVIIVYNLAKWIFGFAGGHAVGDYYALIPYRNTIANILTVCLPAPFYFAGYASKRNLSQVGMFLVGCLIYSAMLMTVARTALLFGTIVLICCLIYYLKGTCEWYFKLASILVVLLGVSVVGFSLYEPIIELFSSRLQDGLATVGEARWQFLMRSFSDFLEHPIFGIGYASHQNADIYRAPGCISWYHLYFPQIWGGLGLVGCAAFGYQLFLRAKLVLYRPNCKTIGVALTYLGLFLYSQTDPGEFIPLPFGALAVLMFVLLEYHYEKGKAAEAAEKAAVTAEATPKNDVNQSE